MNNSSTIILLPAYEKRGLKISSIQRQTSSGVGIGLPAVPAYASEDEENNN